MAIFVILICMKIQVVSDIHSRKIAIKKALEIGKKMGCEAIFFCGDTSDPETFSILCEDGRPLYAVLGNIETDIEKTKELAKNSPHVTFDPYVLTFAIDGKSIALTHYPHSAEQLAKEETYDAVFHGHTYKSRIEYMGRVLIGNPGEISGHITGRRSFGVYDTTTGSFDIIKVEI